MKRIVLSTAPDRLDVERLQRLQWVFPECPVGIVAFVEGRDPAALRQDTVDAIAG